MSLNIVNFRNHEQVSCFYSNKFFNYRNVLQNADLVAQFVNFSTCGCQDSSVGQVFKDDIADVDNNNLRQPFKYGQICREQPATNWDHNYKIVMEKLGR